MATIVVLLVYLGAAFLLGGPAGLAIGVAAVATHLGTGRRTAPLWAASVACMAAVPIALMAQGLPGEGVVGPRFAEEHWVAHLLTGASLALATLAILVETVTPDRVAPPPPRANGEVPSSVPPTGPGAEPEA